MTQRPMKGKRYTTEDKIRILRAADTGKSVLDVCREHNISEVSFHEWKRQFGQMEISEARKLEELERENGLGSSSGGSWNRRQIHCKFRMDFCQNWAIKV